MKLHKYPKGLPFGDVGISKDAISWSWMLFWCR